MSITETKTSVADEITALLNSGNLIRETISAAVYAQISNYLRACIKELNAKITHTELFSIESIDEAAVKDFYKLAATELRILDKKLSYSLTDYENLAGGQNASRLDRLNRLLADVAGLSYPEGEGDPLPTMWLFHVAAGLPAVTHAELNLESPHNKTAITAVEKYAKTATGLNAAHMRRLLTKLSEHSAPAWSKF